MMLPFRSPKDPRATGIAFLFLLFCAIAPLSASGSGNAEGTGSGVAVAVTDHYGRSVSLEGPAERVVSLAPGITETVFALGYGERLVGRTTYCDYPAEAAGIPAVGTLTEPDPEAVLAVDPDIVLASTHFPEDSLQLLESVGLTVAVLMGDGTIEGTCDGVIRPLALLLGDPEEGERLVREMEATVEDALALAESREESPTVYYAVGFGEGGDWTAGGDTFIGRMIAMAGGTNVAADVRGWSFSLESLVAADPDIVILPDREADRFLVTPVYADLRASREGRVYGIDEDAMSREGPRIASAFAELVRILGETP